MTQQDVDQTRGPGGGPRPRELFPPPSGLMFQGSFAQARQAAAQSNRWLVTTINKVTEFQCQVVNRDVWSSARVQELIREQFILWQGYSDTEDGKRYMVLYGINDWPHIAIIDPRTGEKMASWQKVDVDSFHETASDFLAHYPAPSVSDLDLRPTKKAKTESSTGNATSDASHQVPATSRPGPSGSGRGPQTDDVGTDVDGADSDSDSNDAPEDGQQDESWKEHKGDDSDPMTTIVFRGPFNSRHQLTLPNSSTLMALVSFMTGLGYAANRYELLALFPNRVISQLDLGLTLAEAGLGARETLQIHRKRR